MPTKKTTKSKKEKPQPKPQPDQPQTALTASRIHLGPPFAGQGPYPGGAWGKYPPYDGRVTPCPGFWGYVKRFPTVGGIIAQLGAETGTGAAGCSLYSYYQYVFTPTVAGNHYITLTMNMGPVSRSHRYGRVQIVGVLQIMGAGNHWADFHDDLPSHSAVSMAIAPILRTDRVYTLRFGVAPIVENAGYASYGEAILNSADLKQYLPYGVQATNLAPSAATGGIDVLSLVLNSGGEQEAENISLHDAVASGVGYSS